MELDRYLSPLFFPKRPCFSPLFFPNSKDFEATRSPPPLPSRTLEIKAFGKIKGRLPGAPVGETTFSHLVLPRVWAYNSINTRGPVVPGSDGRCSPRCLNSPDVEENSHANTETAQQLSPCLFESGEGIKVAFPSSRTHRLAWKPG